MRSVKTRSDGHRSIKYDHIKITERIKSSFISLNKDRLLSLCKKLDLINKDNK